VYRYLGNFPISTNYPTQSLSASQPLTHESTLLVESYPQARQLRGSNLLNLAESFFAIEQYFLISTFKQCTAIQARVCICANPQPATYPSFPGSPRFVVRVMVGNMASPILRRRERPPSSSSRTFNRQCQFCDKRFSKTEHLLRHERSHTKERPFHCVRCNKVYSRQYVRMMRTQG
jgi:hypothetical protein